MRIGEVAGSPDYHRGASSITQDISTKNHCPLSLDGRGLG